MRRDSIIGYGLVFAPVCVAFVLALVFAPLTLAEIVGCVGAWWLFCYLAVRAGGGPSGW